MPKGSDTNFPTKFHTQYVSEWNRSVSAIYIVEQECISYIYSGTGVYQLYIYSGTGVYQLYIQWNRSVSAIYTVEQERISYIYSGTGAYQLYI